MRNRRLSARAQTELDLIGIFAFGISGALMAICRDFDVVGIAILAVITALGGGILRPRPRRHAEQLGETLAAR